MCSSISLRGMLNGKLAEWSAWAWTGVAAGGAAGGATGAADGPTLEPGTEAGDTKLDEDARPEPSL